MGRPALAITAGISASYLKALEIGDRTTTRLPVIRALAEVLHVEIDAITRPVKIVTPAEFDGDGAA